MLFTYLYHGGTVLFVLFCFVPFYPSFSLFGVYICMYYGYVPGIISLETIRDDMPQLIGTVSLRAGTAMHVLFCSVSSI